MTDLELLQKVITDLDNINVPAGLIRQIGIPIMNASGNLKQLYDFVMDNAKKQEEKPADDDDDIHIGQPYAVAFGDAEEAKEKEEKPSATE